MKVTIYTKACVQSEWKAGILTSHFSIGQLGALGPHPQVQQSQDIEYELMVTWFDS